MSDNSFQLATLDNRPYFESALRFGVKNGLISAAKISAIETEAPKGMVQMAEVFGSKYLRPEIDMAQKRIVNLVSLYLKQSTQGDLTLAAKMISDNTFLTLSRGGSGLLKALFVMPEYALLGREEKGRVEDFLEVWSRKDNDVDYLNTLEQRKTNATEIAAAFWFGEQLGLSRAALQEHDADATSVVRTAMLLRMLGKKEESLVNQVEFAKLIDAVRKKGKISKRTKDIFEPIPTEYQAIADRIQQEISDHDLPKILSASLALDAVVFELKDRYFIRDYELEDTSEYDALVSKEWTKLTKGKTDVYALLTVFFCLSAGAAPKTVLTEANAKTLVKKIRKDGFHPELAIEFIKTAAPHEKQDSLLEEWNDFVQEADAYLLDDWDSSFSGALRFLDTHCDIEKSKK
ncbi:hypothetical protein AAKU64_002305 [Undibacterium sp. GrIS 1.8]|uniref:hypothetical protein n=1 Tax=Undibacterium sp. GrIS 1.8 TaxID=3143934 RepID=UPI0033935473